MLKIKIETEASDKTSLAIEIEHISQLINENWREGLGWKIEGENESTTETDEELSTE